MILFLTDQELDKASGLYNYDARLYDPIIGRFVSADTVVPDFSNSQAYDRYAYTLNNPIKYTDPSGHFAIMGTLAAIAAYKAAVVTFTVTSAVITGLFIGEQLDNHGVFSKSSDSSNNSPKSNPFTGKPGRVEKLDNDDGTPKQDRAYDEDGFPETDIDYDHDHGQGQPHAHDWGRPEDGSDPTHKDRSRGRPLTEEESKSDRSSQQDGTDNDTSVDGQASGSEDGSTEGEN